MKPSCRCGILALVVVTAVWVVGLPNQVAAQPEPSPQEALLLYRDAASYQNNGAFDLAAEEWKRFLERYPDDPLVGRVQHYLGICNLQLRRYEQAAAAFAVVVRDHADFEALEDAYLHLGWCQFTLGVQEDPPLLAEAVETLTALLEKYPEGKNREQAWFFLGEAEYHQDRKEQAAAAYAQLLDEFPQTPLRSDTLYALGVTYEELGRYEQAGRIYDTFLEESEDQALLAEIQVRKAETILQAGDVEAAAEAFAQAAAIPDFDAADYALSRQAFCLSRLERFDEAAAVYARIVTEYPESEQAAAAAISAGRAYYRAEQFPQAIEWLETVRDEGGERAVEAVHLLCRIALSEGQPERVLELVEPVLPAAEDSPFLVFLKMHQADAWYETPETRPQALERYLEIARQHAEHDLAPQALYNAAFAALELRQLDQALELVTEFLEDHPEHALTPDVRYVSAESRLQAGQHAEAETAYGDLLEAHAEHGEAHRWRLRWAVSLWLQRKYAEVLELLEPLADKFSEPDARAEAMYLIGGSHFFQNQHPEALTALQASVEAQPDWRQADEAMLLMSRAQQAEGQTEQAIETIQQMIAEFPDSDLLDQANYRYGEYAHAAGDDATAAEQYQAVIDGWPDSVFAPFALYRLGWTHVRMQEPEAAIAAFGRVIADHEGHELVADAYFARAVTRRQAGQYAEVLEDVERFLAFEPSAEDRGEALYQRGLAEVALDQWEDAIATFEQVLQMEPAYSGTDKVLYETGWALKSMDQTERQAEAVDVFARLVEEHPDSPLAAEAHFHVGEAAYGERAFDQAVAAYTAARAGTVQEDLGEKSTYKLGWSYFQQQDYQQAREQFHQQRERYPDGQLAPDAVFMMAECHFRLEEYAQALPAYQAAQEAALSSPVLAVLALLHGGQSAAQLEQWDQAIAMFQQLLEEHPETAYRAEAYFELASAQQNHGDEEAALENYTRAAELSRSTVGARARFMIGQLYFGRKEHERAIREFQRVMYGYGGESASSAVKSWQARSAFEAARCAETQIEAAQPPERGERIAEARKYYQYVLDRHPDSDLVAAAQKRLEALSQL